MEIREDDITDASARRLLTIHLQGMQSNSPAGHVFALDLIGLSGPEITAWTVRIGEKAVAMGALKEIGGGVGELKSMRTHPDYLRKGIAAALLAHMIAVARSRRLKRLSLETGSGPAFEPALALYRAFDFMSGEAFGGYRKSGFNQFMHLDLE